MSNSRAKEIERQRAEALEGLKRAIEDDFNAVQDSYWFSWDECLDYVNIWIDCSLEIGHISAMLNGTKEQLQKAREALQVEVDRLSERYALEEGQRAINREYDSLLEDLANG